MSFDNPTALRLGMTGELNGKHYRVLGRVVLSVTDDGETYFWNEFNLGTDGGEYATLVYEVTERGGEWRLFTMFEPEYPMTAAAAATKRVGDPLNLDGTDVVVTLLDHSHVRFIEGQGPDGVAVGEEAQYFNAEAGDIMQVVSWTGEEVEFYHGINLASQVVRTAFNLLGAASSVEYIVGKPPAWETAVEAAPSFFADTGVRIMLGVLVATLVFVGYSCVPRHQSVPLKKFAAGHAPLVVGAAALIEGKKYAVDSHAVVEIAEVGLIYQRHEYELTDAAGRPMLLVCGAESQAKDWTLFTPLASADSLSPTQAGTKKVGDTVNLDGLVVHIGQLFRSTVASVEGANASDGTGDRVFYGFSGKAAAQTLLARWNSRSIIFYRGQSIAAKNVTPAVAGELEEKKQ